MHASTPDLYVHLTMAHGDSLVAAVADHRADPDACGPYRPCLDGWTEQLCIDGRDDLADVWDALSCDDQRGILSDATESAEDAQRFAAENLGWLD